MIKLLHCCKPQFRATHLWRKLLPATFTILLLATAPLYAQVKVSSVTDSSGIQVPAYSGQKLQPSYPKVVGYLSFLVPAVVFTSQNATTNFSNHTAIIGFPIGINVLYGPRFGFSYEITPFVVANSKTSKTTNLLFDPGPMFRFNHGFSLITRLAFETSGRYGFTPGFNEVYLRTKDVNYFVTLGLPARFGNSLPASVGLSLQFGFAFN